MFVQKGLGFRLRKLHLYYTPNLFHSTQSHDSVNLAQLLDISKSKAEYVYLKYPILSRFPRSKLKAIIDTVNDLGLSKEILLEEPRIFSLLPITLQYRFKVFQECGFHTINAQHLASYLQIMKRISIQELKAAGIIAPTLNVENRLASYMTQWPTSLTTFIQFDINQQTLYNLRIKIIQRYLELTLDLTEGEFVRGITTYPTIKHRPLQMINETLMLLQSNIMMPTNKIKSNMYLIHVSSDNLKQIIYKLRSIGGIDVKEILRAYPKLCLVNYANMNKTKKIFEEFGISNEAQVRCFSVYTLSPDTIRNRLEKAKQTPEFQVYFNHPRFLKIIMNNKNAAKRIFDLYNSNKRCLSLNSLSGSRDHYKKFQKAPGDCSGKGKDLLFCLSQDLGKEYTVSDVRRLIKRHPFWINIPLIHVKLVFKKLAANFATEDIYENCILLLYPWNVINDTLKLFNSNNNQELFKLLPLFGQVDLIKLSKSQILSLTLYILEKKHYFSGNGVWTIEQLKEVSPYNHEHNKYLT